MDNSHVKSSSRYSLLHILPTCSEHASSLTFPSANRAIQSGDVWYTFADLIFQKCSEHAILLKFEVQIESKRALATVLCTFCRQLSQIDGRTRRNRHPTSAMKEATLPEKTHGFARKTFLTREFTRSRTATLLPHTNCSC